MINRSINFHRWKTYFRRGETKKKIKAINKEILKMIHESRGTRFPIDKIRYKKQNREIRPISQFIRFQLE